MEQEISALDIPEVSYTHGKRIDDTIRRIAVANAIELVDPSPSEDANTAACAGRTIYLGNFDDPDIKLVAFFHELGHSLMVERGLSRSSGSMSRLSNEGAAWELGLQIAQEYGYSYEYYSKELKWARAQLATYIKDHRGEYKASR